jgi:integrase
MGVVSLALAVEPGNDSSMATLEKRCGKFRVIFYYSSRRFARSLKTKSEREAVASVARLEDNLRRVELGLLSLPDGADVPSFLLSDGRIEAKPLLPTISSLHEFIENYFDSIPAGSMEDTTVAGMRIHVAHLEQVLGKAFPIHSLEAAHLQNYIEKRSKGKGIHGRSLSAATIKKEIVTLRTIWNWSLHMGFVKKAFPNRGLRYPKLTEKPPFQTYAEIERRVRRGGLTPAQEADLWDCAFLSLSEVADLLLHVKQHALQPFLYPMFVFAAHTGARRSEMMRSQLDDIDFEGGTVLIREKKRVKGKLSTRRVPLSPFLCEVLRDWIARHPGGIHTFCQDLDVERSKKNRVDYGPLTSDEAHDHFKRTLRGSPWKRLRGWHVFRHSFCSNCAARGIDQRLINAWVGHQSEAMVQRYRHLIPNQQQDAIRLVFDSASASDN